MYVIFVQRIFVKRSHLRRLPEFVLVLFGNDAQNDAGKKIPYSLEAAIEIGKTLTRTFFLLSYLNLFFCSKSSRQDLWLSSKPICSPNKRDQACHKQRVPLPGSNGMAAVPTLPLLRHAAL